MAITIGATKSNSGNQATSSSFSFNHTTDANTKALVVVVTGMDSSDTDSAVSGITFDSVALSHPVTRYRNGSVFIDIWYKTLPAIASTKSIAVTMGGTCTDVQATAVNLIDSTSTGGIVYDSNDTGTGTGSASAIVNPAKTGSMAVGGGVAQGGTTTSLSVSTGTEITGSEVDMGNQTASVGNAAESGGTATITWTYSAVQCDAFAATFYSQFNPTVALDDPTAGETVTDTTPDLLFTGTDANTGDTMEYQLQVDTATSFDSATIDEYELTNRNTGFSIGGGVTFQGVGTSFTGNGHILTGVTLSLYRSDVVLSGNATIEIYAHSGVYGTSSVPTGSALASATYDVSSLSTTPTAINIPFTASNQISLLNGTYYVLTIKYSGGDVDNYLFIGDDSTSPTHDGNGCRWNSSVWDSGKSSDLVFKLHTATIDSLSTDALGDFEAGHPWDTAEQVTYTVQSALTPSTTYYWRVRGKDNVTGIWGAWSTGAGSGYESFVIAADTTTSTSSTSSSSTSSTSSSSSTSSTSSSTSSTSSSSSTSSTSSSTSSTSSSSSTSTSSTSSSTSSTSSSSSTSSTSSSTSSTSSSSSSTSSTSSSSSTSSTSSSSSTSSTSSSTSSTSSSSSTSSTSSSSSTSSTSSSTSSTSSSSSTSTTSSSTSTSSTSSSSSTSSTSSSTSSTSSSSSTSSTSSSTSSTSSSSSTSSTSSSTSSTSSSSSTSSTSSSTSSTSSSSSTSSTSSSTSSTSSSSSTSSTSSSSSTSSTSSSSSSTSSTSSSSSTSSTSSSSSTSSTSSSSSTSSTSSSSSSSTSTTTLPPVCALIQQDGFYILQEIGDKILLEDCSNATTTSTSSTSSSTSTTSTSTSSTSSSSSSTSSTSSTSSSSSTSTTTTTLPAACVIDQQQDTRGGVGYSFGMVAPLGIRRAQQFTPSQTAKICNVQVSLNKFNNPIDSVVLEIYSDSSGLPGTLISEADDRASGSALSTSFELLDFNFTDGPQLTINTPYWIVLSRSGALNDTDRYAVEAAGGNLYGGNFAGDFGSGWTTTPNVDFYFKEYYDNTTIVTTTSTSSSSSTSSTSSSSSTSSTSSSSTSSTSSSSSTSSTSSSSSTSTSSTSSSSSSSTSSTSSSTSSTSSSTSSTSSSSSTSSTSSSSSSSTSSTSSSTSSTTSSTSSSTSSTSSSSSSTSSTSSSSSTSTTQTMPLEFDVILDSLQTDIQNAQAKIDIIENMFGLENDNLRVTLDVTDDNKPESNVL